MIEDKSRRIVFTGASGGIGTMTRPLLAQLYPGLVLSDRIEPSRSCDTRSVWSGEGSRWP